MAKTARNPRIEIGNFMRMVPQAPQYSPKNQNYLVAGANPAYYLDSGIQEQQAGPLAASVNWAGVSGGTDGNVTCMIPSTNPLYSVFLVDDTGKVYGLTATTLTDLGYPTGSALVGHAGCYISTAGGYIFFTDSTNSNIYYIPITGGSWMTFGSLSNTGVHIMEPFLSSYVAVADGATTLNTVYLINYTPSTPAVLSTPTVVLGKGWGIMGMRNYNNKYLAVAGGLSAGTGSANGYAQNYVFLWDGIANSYNQSVKIPGQYLDMKVIDSVLYVAVRVNSGKTRLYYLDNITLKEVLTTQYSTISSGVYAPVGCSIFSFKNFIGMHLDTTIDMADPILVYGSDEAGQFEFVYSYGIEFDQIVTGYDGNIYGTKYNVSAFSQLFYLPLSPIGAIYQNILYRSQWIPVESLSSVDIFYDSPPQQLLDTISVTLYGRGEDIIAGSGAYALATIGYQNFLNQKRTNLDASGFAGSEVMVQLSTNSGSGTTWVPIIRRISLIMQ